MSLTAIIGGTGLTQLKHLKITHREKVTTPFGNPSSDLVFGDFHQQKLVFLARHGNPHIYPPHRVNYRANIWALKQAGASCALAIAAVGGITSEMRPGRISIPDQLIDYSYGRHHTFFDEDLESVTHIDFTDPYTPWLREKLLTAADTAGLVVARYGVYGCTQGPRLETPAEIRRMEQDGCDLVGMTGMPEASLARELNLDYASCAVIANWAAGKQSGEITMAEIEANLHMGMSDLSQLLEHWIQS